ncbi:hypothetical protein FGB62_45g163 [Gracilaria domingensis]|nr:hypothetical protein FGB62_45g163 [Gracilaria domingensis]
MAERLHVYRDNSVRWVHHALLAHAAAAHASASVPAVARAGGGVAAAAAQRRGGGVLARAARVRAAVRAHVRDVACAQVRGERARHPASKRAVQGVPAGVAHARVRAADGGERAAGHDRRRARRADAGAGARRDAVQQVLSGGALLRAGARRGGARRGARRGADVRAGAAGAADGARAAGGGGRGALLPAGERLRRGERVQAAAARSPVRAVTRLARCKLAVN